MNNYFIKGEEFKKFQVRLWPIPFKSSHVFHKYHNFIMYNYLMNHFQLLFCHIIKWTHQLLIIRALQFTYTTSSRAIQSGW